MQKSREITVKNAQTKVRQIHRFTAVVTGDCKPFVWDNTDKEKLCECATGLHAMRVAAGMNTAYFARLAELKAGK
jgi:hypothetical protein